MLTTSSARTSLRDRSSLISSSLAASSRSPPAPPTTTAPRAARTLNLARPGTREGPRLPPREAREFADLPGRQGPDRAGPQPAERDRTDAEPDQPRHRQADGGEEPANLALASLRH